MQKAYLILENGMILEGIGFGASGTVMGELVFTTGMTGCIESLTDPSYFGQIVMFTFPQLGNYGIALPDKEGPHCQLRGVVCREYCETPSNFRSDLSVDAFLKQENVIGIAGLDTRQLTQLIRTHGVLNAVITTEAPAASQEALSSFSIQDAVASTSTKTVETLLPNGTPRFQVALLDYGAKGSVSQCLLDLGCQVTILPHDTPAADVLELKPDGVMLSNGPGDPAENAFCIAQIQALFGKMTMFGICLGHQMMALASGGKTVKLKFGHRGANQPVKDLATGKVSVTSQNHGYAVDGGSLTGTSGIVSHVNVNDGTCEGVFYPEKQAFSLQFHPEAHGGPLDCISAFDQFISMMEENKNA